MENIENENNVVLLENITEEQFNNINNEAISEEEKWVSFYYGRDIHGISYDDKLVGIFRLIRFIGNSLSIDMYISKEYRGKGIAAKALDQIPIVFGEKYPDVEYFMANPEPANKNSIKAVEKAQWIPEHAYDEMMYEEGGTFYKLYKKENPYYEKKSGLKL